MDLGQLHVVNSEYRKGKATSVRAGLRVVDTEATDIVPLAVDQPRPPDVIAAIVTAHTQKDALITSPRYRVGAATRSARLRGELQAVTEEPQGVRAVFRGHSPRLTRSP